MRLFIAAAALIAFAAACQRPDDVDHDLAAVDSAGDVYAGLSADATGDQVQLYLSSSKHERLGLCSLAAGETCSQSHATYAPARQVYRKGERRILGLGTKIAADAARTYAVIDDVGQVVARFRIAASGGSKPGGGAGLALVKQLITTKSIKTLDDLIAALPDSYRRHSTLAFRTGSSLQKATADLPRAIVFAPDASLLLAFGADGPLEMISFDKATAEFSFHEVTEGAGNLLTISEHDPGAKCSACHGGANLRPNWQSYPDWPGFFGSQDDAAPNGSVELAAAGRFARTYKGLPRYKHLPDLERKYEVFREVDSVSTLTPGVKAANFRSPINRAMTVAIAEKNNQRIAALLIKQASYAKNKYLIASVLADCLPRPAGPHGDVPAVAQAEYARIAQKVPGLDGIFAQSSPATRTLYDRLVLANQKLQLGLQIDIDNWSTSHRFTVTDEGQKYYPRNPFDDSARGPNTAAEPSTLYLIAAAMGERDPDLQGLADFLCEALQLPLNMGSADVAVVGKHFCRAGKLAGRGSSLAKYGPFNGDGHQATCQVIAKKWLESL